MQKLAPQYLVEINPHVIIGEHPRGVTNHRIVLIGYDIAYSAVWVVGAWQILLQVEARFERINICESLSSEMRATATVIETTLSNADPEHHLPTPRL